MLAGGDVRHPHVEVVAARQLFFPHAPGQATHGSQTRAFACTALRAEPDESNGHGASDGRKRRARGLPSVIRRRRPRDVPGRPGWTPAANNGLLACHRVELYTHRATAVSQLIWPCPDLDVRTSME